MRVKVLSVALLAALIALPVPASQLLARTFSPSAPQPAATARSGALATLIADPFLIDRLSLVQVRSASDAVAL
jgi:hypothetical protein